MHLRTTLALLLAATTFAHADVTHLECTQIGPTEYKLTYELTGDTHGVEISASQNPDPAAPMQRLQKTKAQQITLHAGAAGRRIFFFLKADTGELREVSIRHLALEGTPNFRDLGGYRTTDNRFVRWGLLYRSGVLTYLTPADFAYLTQAGIRVVCDFRTAQENQAAPERWIPGAPVDHLSLPIGTQTGRDGKPSVQVGLSADQSPEHLRASMTKTYGSFAFASAPQFAQLFTQLEGGHLPLLYHCSAGKDRTGVFSALVLLTLGVPETTVLDDYALTNRYLLDQPNSAAMQKLLSATGNNSISAFTPEQRKVMMAAIPEYLRSTLRAIDARYGSFDNYRRQELHVSDAQVQDLRAKLLMP